ncbi:aspartate-semialdehyde dehydrogenase [Anaerolinea thermophila]|uniref:Aspartate-semialdehyde dehydrogenase n=2 Tax=Anaerolinea TaxID=233189 RepID=E8N3U6_ANATU|nr:aspartate-semialdehyde dehydrogenase [Anaerolinea thermophila]BAJ63110.1 aspartate-semialdehyde dehydrogenase [Anaerolinea thermophila UNI-1]
MKRIPVGVLAATGSVGQRFIQLLEGHPWFEVVAVTGSDRGTGKPYGEVCRWLLPGDMPERVRNLPVLPTSPEAVQVPLVFSALPAEIAQDAEPAFARAGIAVCSNASAYRKDPDVPILLPEVNPDHAHLIPVQQSRHQWTGWIATNPNCTSTGMTVALKALQDRFGLKRVFAVSMQALSGAGYPGVPAMDIIDNIIPFISGEEDKVEWEPRKMLGTLGTGGIQLADFGISAHTNRVNVSDGHTVCLTIELEMRASAEEVKRTLREYQAPEIACNLPSTPLPPILVREEENRPQPRLDRMTGNGMTTVVGRVRADSLFDIRLVVLSHNTIRGAAGGSIYNAELLYRMGYIPKP